MRPGWTQAAITTPSTSVGSLSCLALFFMFTFVFLIIPLQKLTVLQHVKLPRGALHIHWCAVCRAADAPVRIWMSVTSYWTWIKQKKQTKIMLIKNSCVFRKYIQLPVFDITKLLFQRSRSSKPTNIDFTGFSERHPPSSPTKKL